MKRFNLRAPAAVLVALLALTVGMLGAPSTTVLANDANVVNGADSGPGSFRQAIADANSDPHINQIRFRPGLAVALQSSVVYTGRQSLVLSGRGSTLSGTGVPKEAHWNGGLFVSRSAAGLTVRDLRFQDSFNNGLAVFIPPTAGGTVRVRLDNVRVDASTFFGVLVDGQAFAGFNTDDVPHPNCVDPHFFNSNAGIAVEVENTTVTRSGELPGGYDLSIATGCPADFDGIRVDDGGAGDIDFSISRSVINDNLADGVELDEAGSGSIRSRAVQTLFNGNGDSGTADPDDGFDIDEAGDGGIDAYFLSVQANGNFDEGLDLDEEGPGDVTMQVVSSQANGNEDEGVKIDEADGGDVRVRMERSQVRESDSQDGVELNETGSGNLDAQIDASRITGNDNFGVKVLQDDGGTGKLRIVSSTLTGNNDGAIDNDGGVTVSLINTTT